MIPFTILQNIGRYEPEDNEEVHHRVAGKLCPHGWFWYLDAKKHKELPVIDCAKCRYFYGE